jgi:hypothetical protein
MRSNIVAPLRAPPASSPPLALEAKFWAVAVVPPELLAPRLGVGVEFFSAVGVGFFSARHR